MSDCEVCGKPNLWHDEKSGELVQLSRREADETGVRCCESCWHRWAADTGREPY